MSNALDGAVFSSLSRRSGHPGSSVPWKYQFEPLSARNIPQCCIARRITWACAEEREQAVPGKVLNRAAVRLDDPDHPADRLTNHQLDVLGIEPFSKRSRTDHISEQGGDDAALFSNFRHSRVDSSTRIEPVFCVDSGAF